jgi:hypothetical protein
VSEARIILRRDRDLFGAARKYAITIDGAEVAQIANGQELTIPVTAGRHTVGVRLGGSGSNDLSLDLGPHDRAAVRCRRAGNAWTKFFFGTYWPRPTIVLTEEPGDAEPFARGDR